MLPLRFSVVINWQVGALQMIIKILEMILSRMVVGTLRRVIDYFGGENIKSARLQRTLYFKLSAHTQFCV